MRDVLAKALSASEDPISTDRILAAAFFRKRPLQAGSSAQVVLLADFSRAEGERDVAPVGRATRAQDFSRAEGERDVAPVGRATRAQDRSRDRLTRAVSVASVVSPSAQRKQDVQL